MFVKLINWPFQDICQELEVEDLDEILPSLQKLKHNAECANKYKQVSVQHNLPSIILVPEIFANLSFFNRVLIHVLLVVIGQLPYIAHNLQC